MSVNECGQVDTAVLFIGSENYHNYFIIIIIIIVIVAGVIIIINVFLT